MNFIIAGILGVVLMIGSVVPSPYDSWLSRTSGKFFGTTAFPTALDTLTNPSGTDSVATVSHSGQHSNANDAIEALEAKLGTGASTAVSNSLFTGTGSGASGWSTNPTVTGLTLTNLLATGSTTLQNFTFLNATGTAATTTNFYSGIVTAAKIFGTDTVLTNLVVTSCTGCVALGGGTISSFSTTSIGNMATMTIPMANIPDKSNIRVVISSPNTSGPTIATSTANIVIGFNQFQDAAQTNLFGTRQYAPSGTFTQAEDIAVNQVVVTNSVSPLVAGGERRKKMVIFEVRDNSTTTDKLGIFTSHSYATTSAVGANGASSMVKGDFFWATSTTKIKSIDIWYDVSRVYFGTSTVIRVEGY